MKKTFNRGFTLIELLVVIAIIGILASVVLASLNSARDKGTDAAIQASVNSIRAQAEISGQQANGSVDYSTVCTDAATIITDVEAKNGSGTGTYCSDETDTWAFASNLVGAAGDYICVDSTGASTIATGVIDGTETATACSGL